MTQDDIQSILNPLEKKYDAVRGRLNTLQKEDYYSEDAFNLYQQNLIGQVHAYQQIIRELLDIKMRIALRECNVAT